jgi:ubiquinone/menaquinone biosynthesis C-methylase UbiE
MGRKRFEAEFGHYAGWVVDAIQQIGFHDPVPPACRGTGNPFLLEHLAAGLAIEKGSLVLDVGVGLGGPGAWLVRKRACKVVGVDIMIQAARGASRLFADIDVAVASTRALPFRHRTFDAAWALGVIEMLADKQRAFREIARVLVPGARVVLYDFVATELDLHNPPAADRFESAGDISRKLEKSGLNVLRSEAVTFMSPPPEDWRAATMTVRERIRDEHSGDRRLSMEEQERNNFNRLRQRGSIEEWEFLAEKPR